MGIAHEIFLVAAIGALYAISKLWPKFKAWRNGDSPSPDSSPTRSLASPDDESEREIDDAPTARWGRGGPVEEPIDGEVLRLDTDLQGRPGAWIRVNKRRRGGDDD